MNTSLKLAKDPDNKKRRDLLWEIAKTELEVWFYLLFNWGEPPSGEGLYTYHQESGIRLILGTLMSMLVVETFVAHLLLNRWNVTVAWIATLTSIYASLQLLALMRSLPYLPIVIDSKKGELLLRYGFFTSVSIPLSSIKETLISSRTVNEDDCIELSPLAMLSTHNVVIHLKEEQVMSSFYGKRKPFKSICLFVDNKAAFVEELQALSS